MTKDKVVQVKQIPSLFVRENIKTNAGASFDFTTHPNSIRVYSPQKNVRGEWITGLTEEEETKFGKILNKDLSVHSDYWKSLEIYLVNRTSLVTFNLSNPEQYIRYKCALANKFLAETKEQLKEPEYTKDNCFLYVYDPEGDAKRRSELQELRDECTSLIYATKGNKEKQMYLCAKLGMVVHTDYTSSFYYNMLTSHLANLSKTEALTKFKNVLSTDNQTLFVEFTVNKQKNRAIKYQNEQWVFGNTIIGKTDKLYDFFIKDEDMFMLLLEADTQK